MNNDHNNQGGSYSNENEPREEIRFDERDFQNPYSRYYSASGEKKNNKHGGANPYSKYFSSDKGVADGSADDDEIFSEYYEDPGDIEFKVREDVEPCVRAPFIDELVEKNNLFRIGIGYALFSIIAFAVSLVIQLIVLNVNRDFYDSTLFINLVTPISLYLFALPVLLIVLSKCEAAAPEKKKMGLGTFLLFVITAFGFMYIGAMIGNSVMDTLSFIMNYDYSNGLNSIVDDENIWITAIFTVIVAPIGEEFVFRKLIIDRTHKYGSLVSIGLSGLMFGLMHGNLYQFFYCFALGLLLGYIYYNTGRLYLTIAIHAIVNFVGSVLTSFIAPAADELASLDPSNTDAFLTFIQENLLSMVGIMIFNAFVYAAMACAVIFPIVFRKKLKLDKGAVPIQTSRRFPIIILNGGTLVMLFVYISEFIINLLPF